MATGGDLDKTWVVCDDTSTSPFYGHCYATWDDHGNGNLAQMSTSTDGGLTWGMVQTTADSAGVIGGQPLVQPGGTVIVPVENAFETSIGAFQSTDGGTTWSAVTTIRTVSHHTEAGGLRSGSLPSAEIDGAGKVYVTWSDCRFRSRCRANDLVLSSSSNGTTWSAVARVPIDATNSGRDHFLPGLAVDKATSGGTAHLGLTYYFYPTSSCSSTTCKLEVGFIASTNGGATWGTATQLAGPMTLGWLANTSQGRMVGDYISTSYGSDGLAHGAFMTATAPTSGTTCGAVTDNCNEPADTTASGLAIRGGSTSAAGDTVVGGGAQAPTGNVWATARGGNTHR